MLECTYQEDRFLRRPKFPSCSNVGNAGKCRTVWRKSRGVGAEGPCSVEVPKSSAFSPRRCCCWATEKASSRSLTQPLWSTFEYSAHITRPRPTGPDTDLTPTPGAPGGRPPPLRSVQTPSFGPPKSGGRLPRSGGTVLTNQSPPYINMPL